MMTAMGSSTNYPRSQQTADASATTTKPHGDRYFEQMVLPGIGFHELFRYIGKLFRRATRT
jgi:hypothetical protein